MVLVLGAAARGRPQRVDAVVLEVRAFAVAAVGEALVVGRVLVGALRRVGGAEPGALGGARRLGATVRVRAPPLARLAQTLEGLLPPRAGPATEASAAIFLEDDL